MKVENIKAQMRKGVLELCVLGLLSKETMYPSDIIQNLKKNDLIVVEGTMYPLLNRLKRDGYLSYNWVESSSGPPRKYYEITPKGNDLKEELTKAWENLAQTVNFSNSINTTNNE
ncbi:PadR family transcriptional regulator [Membranicola marinus]|uniref:PadR family transcriptional regulator n=1 Tax=Membranihabitans marinus TaxID=1227546 RepID=A0A953L9W5_9BACT|nr:PadR family transcriptional regulator [Membranihabitans marinus]MBY5959265.1 PadR family transcriptional regulator [Membranihabitans marinus]